MAKLRKQQFMQRTKDELWLAYREAYRKLDDAKLQALRGSYKDHLISTLRRELAVAKGELRLLDECVGKGVPEFRRENEFLRGRLGELPDIQQAIFDSQQPPIPWGAH